MNTEQHTPIPTPSQKHSVAAFFFITLALFLGLGALGGGFYLWQQLETSKQQIAEQNKMLSTALKQLETTDNTLDKQQEDLSTQQHALDRLTTLANQRDQTLLLAETEYLVRLAYFSLHFEHNIPQAILLLRTANSRIESAHNPAFLKLQDALTKNMTQLQGTPQPDIAAMLLKLNAFTMEIRQLPLLVAKPASQETGGSPGVAATPDTNVSSAPPSIWRKGWDKTWNTLKTIVVIKREEASTPQMMKELSTPAVNRAETDEQLELLLAQAQWALIHTRSNLYVASLNQALALLTSSYDVTAQPTRALLEGLNELVKVNIHPPIPDLTPSFEFIRALLNQPTEPLQTAETGT